MDVKNLPSIDSVRKITPAVTAAALAVILAPCELYPGVLPFGIAVAAASVGIIPMALATSAGMLSAAFARSPGTVFALASVFLLRYVLSLVKQTKALPILRRLPDGIRPNPLWRAIISSVAVIPVAVAEKEAIPVLLTAVSVPVFTYAFSHLTTRQASEVSAAVLLFALSSSLAGVKIAGFSPAAIIAYTSALMTSRYRGAAKGAILGLVASVPLSAMYSPAYALGPLAAGALPTLPVIPASLLSAVVSLMWASYSGGLTALYSVLPTVAVSVSVAMPLLYFGVLKPKPISATTLPMIEKKRADTAFSGIRQVAEGLNSVASVFVTVSDRLRKPSATELRSICESAISKRCEICENKAKCSAEAEVFASDMVKALANGVASASVVPRGIASRCAEVAAILDEANAEATRAVRSVTLEDKSDVVGESYAAVAGMLTSLYDRLSADTTEDKTVAAALSNALAESGISHSIAAVYGKSRLLVYIGGMDLGRARITDGELRAIVSEATGRPMGQPEYDIADGKVNVRLSGEAVFSVAHSRCSIAGGGETNGDSSVCFANRTGQFYSLISDGMGTGNEAALTSHLVSAFVTRMLSAGAPMPDVLRMLNGYIRSGRLECSATIDLAEIDLYSGNARIVKSGAAPTLVVRSGKAYRLSSKTVPIGILRALDCEMTTLPLSDGDTLIMFSDGVASGTDDISWLCELVTSSDRMLDDTAKAAKAIATAAAHRSYHPDDTTVTVLKVKRR